MTPQEELIKVQTAISSILTGAQSYKTANTNVIRADLKVLYDRQRELQSQIDEELTGGIDVAVFDRR